STFIETLVNLWKGSHADHCRIILTLRSDFEPPFANSALRDYWAPARFRVPMMTHAELREAIEQPAAQRVLYVDSADLVGHIVDEATQTPGTLPLLSFTLSEM